MKHITTHKIPGTVAGSPSWFRDRLSDLLLMVEELGMPSLFLTLTADEMTDTRWDEVIELERLARLNNTEFSWKDCPVECARLFVERTERFMAEHVLSADGIFGKVLHHMIRYEVGPCAER